VRDQATQASNPTPDATAAFGAPSAPNPARRGTFTFRPADRIRKKAEYAAVFAESRKVADRFFVCYLAAREQQGNKMGLAVSRKVGKAVARNRVKRYLREFYRTHRPQMHTPCELVVVARPEAASLDYAGCVSAMRRLLQKGGVLDG